MNFKSFSLSRIFTPFKCSRAFDVAVDKLLFSTVFRPRTSGVFFNSREFTSVFFFISLELVTVFGIIILPKGHGSQIDVFVKFSIFCCYRFSALNGSGIFFRRKDFSAFNILPRHKLNSYHVKVRDLFFIEYSSQ